jgi:hypothetical protein
MEGDAPDGEEEKPENSSVMRRWRPRAASAAQEPAGFPTSPLTSELHPNRRELFRPQHSYKTGARESYAGFRWPPLGVPSDSERELQGRFRPKEHPYGNVPCIPFLH